MRRSRCGLNYAPGQSKNAGETFQWTPGGDLWEVSWRWGYRFTLIYDATGTFEPRGIDSLLTPTPIRNYTETCFWKLGHGLELRSRSPGTWHIVWHPGSWGHPPLSGHIQNEGGIPDHGAIPPYPVVSNMRGHILDQVAFPPVSFNTKAGVASRIMGL